MNGTRVPNATIREAGTAAFRRTGNNLDAPRKQRLLTAPPPVLILGPRRYNARVQRADDELWDERRVSRSRCNEMLYRRGVTTQRSQTLNAHTLATKSDVPDQRGPSLGALPDHATTAAAAQLR
jgi:hypothetical protein